MSFLQVADGALGPGTEMEEIEIGILLGSLTKTGKFWLCVGAEFDIGFPWAVGPKQARECFTSHHVEDDYSVKILQWSLLNLHIIIINQVIFNTNIYKKMYCICLY